MDRLERRDLYPMVGEVLVPLAFENKVNTEADILQEILTIAENSPNPSSSLLCEAGLYIDKFSLNYGMKDKNPVDHVTFYNRNNATEGRQRKRNTVSNFTPRSFQEFYIRIYIKDSSNNAAATAAREAFDTWVETTFHSSSLIVPSTPNSPARSTERPKKRQRSNSEMSSSTGYSKASIAIRKLGTVEEEDDDAQVEEQPWTNDTWVWRRCAIVACWRTANGRSEDVKKKKKTHGWRELEAGGGKVSFPNSQPGATM